MAQQSENRKSAITACILTAVFLAAVLAAALASRTSQETQIDDSQTRALKETYHAMFGPKPVNASDYSDFNTPVPMYLAAIIGLKHGGWNASSLQNMTVYASLEYCRFTHFQSTLGYGYGYDFISSVKEPVTDYSPTGSQVSEGYWATYRYVWRVIVDTSTETISTPPPPGMYFVDAATAELVSTDAPGS